MANSILETISSEFASAAEKAGASVIAVHGRRWTPSSGIEWRKGVVVTVHHGVQRDEDLKVLLGGGRAVSAKLAGLQRGIQQVQFTSDVQLKVVPGEPAYVEEVLRKFEADREAQTMTYSTTLSMCSRPRHLRIFTTTSSAWREMKTLS